MTFVFQPAVLVFVLQRLGSVRGEDVPYVLGLPLVGGQPFFPHNYTRQDGSVSRLLIHYLSNFARKGCVVLCAIS
jgi:neuroligin